MFTEEHKNVLLNLIEQHKHIIESKMNTVESNIRKKKCWDEIRLLFCREYPLLSLKTQQLRDSYKRMKMGARKKAAIRKKEEKKTGGGMSLAPSTSAVDDRLERIDPTLTAEIVNDYDDDKEEEESSKISESADDGGSERELPAKKSRSWADEVKEMAREEHRTKMRIMLLEEKLLLRKLSQHIQRKF